MEIAVQQKMGSGYKQTEVGVIPNDWDVIELRAKGQCFIGLTYKPSDMRTDGVLVLRSSNVQQDSLKFENNVFVDMAVPERALVQQNDILICVRNGSRELIGKCALIDGRAEGMAFGAFMAIFRTTDYGFVFQQFRSETVKRQIKENLGATINQITNKNLDSFQIPWPPEKLERELIATALRDIDELVDALDKLLAKKRDLKQGAMRQLLTGKSRLPGFHGAWQTKPLGDLIIGCYSGATPRRNRPEYFKGNIRWITSGELNYSVITDTAEKLTKEAVEVTNLKIVPKGTFLMAITGLEAEGTRGSCGIVGEPSTTNQSCMAVFPASELITEYLFQYYVLRGKALALQYCQGTKQQSYTAKLVKQIPIALPPTTEEQTAIARVLSDMDAEIAALQKRRDKARALKQGMMQELLTGKRRLI
jgi:type I restriction enzyme S subunit